MSTSLHTAHTKARVVRTAEESGLSAVGRPLHIQTKEELNRVDGVGTTLKHPRRESKAGDWWKEKSWFRKDTQLSHHDHIQCPIHKVFCYIFSNRTPRTTHFVSLFTSHHVPVMYTVASGCNQQTEEYVNKESSWSTLGLNVTLRPLRVALDKQLN